MSEPVMLDTSVLIDIDSADLGAHADAAVVLSAVTIGELAPGLDARRPDAEARRTRFRAVLADYEILPFGVEEAKLYGALAGHLRAVGANPRPRRLDLQIAATAAAARLPLLTCNPADFGGMSPLVDVVAVTRSA